MGFKGVYITRTCFPDVNIILGGTVHLVCRNRERGEEAKTEIAESTGNQVGLKPCEIIQMKSCVLHSNENLFFFALI